MAVKGKKVEAVAYIRTSPSYSVGQAIEPCRDQSGDGADRQGAAPAQARQFPAGHRCRSGSPRLCQRQRQGVLSGIGGLNARRLRLNAAAPPWRSYGPIFEAIFLAQRLGLLGAAERGERIGGDAGGVPGPGVVRTIDALVRRERSPGELQRFCRAIRHQQQPCIMALVPPRERMFGAECLVAHGDGAKEERLGLVRLTKVLQQASEVAEARRRVRMLGAKHLLADRQRALIERPRPREVALGLQQAGEVVEAHRGVRMLGAKHLLADRQRALIERPRPREVALGLQQAGEVVEAHRGVRMLGIVDFRTLQKSESLPLSFLRGVGLPDNLIEYLPSRPQVMGRDQSRTGARGQAAAPAFTEGASSSLRDIAAELAKLGFVNERGMEFSAASVASMLGT